MTSDPNPRQLRHDWRKYRERLQLTDSTLGGDFARGGLGAFAEPLDVRVVIIPADPTATEVVSLDADTAGWIAQVRPSPYEGQQPEWGHHTTATSDALVRAMWYRDDQLWTRYLAICRHGGLEAGMSDLIFESRDTRGFALRRSAAMVWMVAAIQAEAAEKWSVQGPWEVTLALRNTQGATLADFGEGWAPFGDFRHGGSTCRDAHVLHQWTVDQIDPVSLGLDAGNRIENSFGTTNRRHLARTGVYEGKFDPRFNW
jgi:hypothetical protein